MHTHCASPTGLSQNNSEKNKTKQKQTLTKKEIHLLEDKEKN